MTTFLRIVAWIARILLFAVLFLLAAKNTEPVTVRFLFDAVWHAPLALVVLVALALGAILGLVACLPAHARQRREIAGLSKELAVGGRPPAEPEVPLAAPGAPPVIDAPPVVAAPPRF